LKKEFIVYGLSPDQATEAATVLEGALLDDFAAKAKRSAAIPDVDEKPEAALGYMRRFEALVANTLTYDTATMAEWTVARNVNRVAVLRGNRKPPDLTEPAAPPTAA
jgi:hypothetical protein